MVRLSRRQFLALLGAAVGVSIAGYGAYRVLRRPSGGGGTLKVYNYSYYIDPKVIEMFEEEYGVTVIYDEYEAAEEAWGKLQVGGGGYDLIVLADAYVPQAIKEGLVRMLDHSRLENLGNLDPSFVDNPFDPGLSHAVPYMWGTTGIGYNRALVDEKVTAWAQLFDTENFLPKYSKKVSMLEEFGEVVEAAMYYLGLDPQKTESWTQHKDEIIELLRAQKPFLAGYYGASVYVPDLAAGRLYVAQAWSGDVLTAQDENPDVIYVIPEEGTWRWMDMMVIPRDAKNVEAALLWIDYMLRPDIAARNVAYVYYPASVRKDLVASELSRLADELGVDPGEILENPAIYPDREIKGFSVVMDEEKLKALEEIEVSVKT